MKKRMFAIVMVLILGIVSPLCTTNAYAAKNYSSDLNALVGPYKGYTSIEDLNAKWSQGQTLTSLNFSGEQCVNYALTRLKEKVFGCNVSFGIWTGDGKDVASSFIKYGYGVGGEKSKVVFTAKDGQQYTVTAYTGDNGTHISPNSMVCFNKNSNKTNRSEGHIVFVEETPIIDGVKYVYYTDGGSNSKSWPVKRQTFDAFYNQGIGYTGTIVVIPAATNDRTISISDGTYTLAPQCAYNLRLDVAGAGLSNKTNIQIYTANGTKAQQFRFSHKGDGWYEITAEVSGKVLDVQGGKTTSGTNVQQYSSNGSDAQRWKLTDAGDGYYFITPKLNEALCLDVSGAGKSNGTNVQVWNNNGTDAQKWKLEVLTSNTNQNDPNTGHNGGGYWSEWSAWNSAPVSESNTRKVETRQITTSEARTEYRYGRFVDSAGTHIGWCSKYLESRPQVSGSAVLQYTDWGTTQYEKKPRMAWTCGYCDGTHIGVAQTSSDGRPWWSEYMLPSGSYYWQESRTIPANIETQYRYCDWIQSNS